MIELVSLLLGSLSAIASDPALGYRGATIKSILNLISTALRHGEEGYEQLKQLSAELQRMVDERREPKKEEWAALKDRAQAAHTTIQGWHPTEE